MPKFNIYPQSDFPPALKWQAVAFMRVEWPFIFTGARKFATDPYPPDLHPVHFVAADGDSLVSYASIIRFDLRHAGATCAVYGFGNMFTFPPYRRAGYGTSVLKLASDFIRQSDVDVSILFCGQKMESFYARSGWEATHSPTRIGVPSEYRIHDLLRMMLFVSEKGQRGRKDFQEQPVYIDEPW